MNVVDIFVDKNRVMSNEDDKNVDVKKKYTMEKEEENHNHNNNNNNNNEEHDLESIDVQQTTSNDNDKIKQLERAAQLMFYGGCCLLPWVWGLSIIYFWKLYRSETCPPGIKKYITQSIQGLILVMILFGIWIVIFQTNKGERWAQPLLITPQNDRRILPPDGVFSLTLECFLNDS